MVVNCQIDFDNNPYGTYFAGQVITGKVTLTADKPKKVRGIALKINGYANTRWSRKSNTSARSRNDGREHFHGREDYIASLTYLLGSDADQSHTIEAGIHTYNFACYIPPTCPSSFEGLCGHIRYVVKIVLIRPWKFDQTFTKGFTVLKIMDLNYESPVLRVPANAEIQKTYCCGPCGAKPMAIDVSLAQSGFVPGQNIPIKVNVTNDSYVPVKEMIIGLYMIVYFHSKYPYDSCRTDKVIVSRIKGEGVAKNCRETFNYELPVPATPPTCLNLCRIIQISYEVGVEAKVNGFYSSQVIGVPVTIGNVPIMSVIEHQPMGGMKRNFDGINENPTNIDFIATEATAPESPMPWSASSNIPPPSYEEALHVPRGCINEDENHDFGESYFAPRYTVFKMANSISEPAGKDEIDGSKTTNGTWL